MELGTVFFFGALGTLAFLVGKLIGSGTIGIGIGKKPPMMKGLLPMGKGSDMEAIASLLKQLDGATNRNKKPDEVLSLDKVFTDRFADLEDKSKTLIRAVTLFKRKSDDLWMDIRDKYRLGGAEQISVNDDHTKLNVFK